MNTYTITNPTDLFNLVMSVYGTLEESVKFVSDNSAVISSFNMDICALAGNNVYFDTTLVSTSLTPVPILATPPDPVTEYIWTGRQGQNMFDVCIQTYGVLEEQIKLMSDNNIDFSTTVYQQLFNYDSTLISNSNIWNRTTGMDLVISSGN
jgi:hypothetical protein